MLLLFCCFHLVFYTLDHAVEATQGKTEGGCEHDKKNSGCCVGDKQQLHDGSRYDDGTGYTSTCPALQHATFL
jgi:hypothetical protein